LNKCWILALIGADALTKALALRWIPPLNGSFYPFGGIPVFKFLGVSCSLNTIANTGVAWGFFANYFPFLLVLRIGVAIALCIYLFRHQERAHGPLCFILAGAIGNIIDMFFYAHVIDFIHFRFFGWSFPIFNLADSCITVGVLLLLIWPKKLQCEASDAR
jgi:signal peptidase II